MDTDGYPDLSPIPSSVTATTPALTATERASARVPTATGAAATMSDAGIATTTMPSTGKTTATMTSAGVAAAVIASPVVAARVTAPVSETERQRGITPVVPAIVRPRVIIAVIVIGVAW